MGTQISGEYRFGAADSGPVAAGQLKGGGNTFGGRSIDRDIETNG